MKDFDVILLMPFDEFDIVASSEEDAIAIVKETDWPLQIHPDSLHLMVARRINKKRFAVYMLTPRAGNTIKAKNEMDAYNKSIMNEFTIRYVPYAISVNDKIIKVDMNGLKT